MDTQDATSELDDEQRRRRAEAVFARHVGELAPSREPDLEALQAAHPELKRELARVHESWLRMLGAFRSLADEPPASGAGPGPSAAASAAADASVGPEHGAGSGVGADRHDPGAAAGMDSLVGVEIEGRIRIESILGRGGMGVVYAGTHLGLGRPVAVKFLSELALAHTSARERFERECRALGRLRHPHVVGVLDQGDFRGLPYLVMERIDGASLAQWVQHARATNARPAALRAGDVAAFLRTRAAGVADSPSWTRSYWEFAAAVLAPIARALAAAHEAGIVHRDLKPSNVLLDAAGKPFLSDFGLVALRGEASLASRSGPLGTFAYMAPEQLRAGEARLDPRVDVYGLGACLYELITLSPPFDGSPPAVLARLAVALPRAPHALVPQVPRDLEAICLKAMEPRPSDRYGSAASLAEDLEAFVERRPVAARHPSTMGRLARWSRRRPALASALMLAALLVPTSASALWMASERREVRAADDNAREVAETTAHLPGLLTLEHNPGRKRARPYREPAAVGARLDRLVELEPAEPALRFYRASFRSQHDDLGGARADLEWLGANGQRTELLDQLGATLAAEEEAARWSLPRFEELPARKSAFDHFVAGYVALRWGRGRQALAELDLAVDEAPPQSWRYRDLRAIAALVEQKLDLAVEDASFVEKKLGLVTARTAHVRGVVQLYRGDAVSAEAHCRASLELCPDQHGPFSNLGLACMRLDRLDDALAALERAIEIRPEARSARAQKGWILRDSGRFEEALVGLEEGLALGTDQERRSLTLDLSNVRQWWGRNLALAGNVEAAGEQFSRARTLQDELAREADSSLMLRIQENRLLGAYFAGEERADAVALGLWQNLNARLKQGSELTRETTLVLTREVTLVANLAWILEQAGFPAQAETLHRLALTQPSCPPFALHNLQDLILRKAAAALDSGEAPGALDALLDSEVHRGSALERARSLRERALELLEQDQRPAWTERFRRIDDALPPSVATNTPPITPDASPPR